MCDNVVREFELQTRHYVHFRTNTLGKGMNPQITLLWIKSHHYRSSRIALVRWHQLFMYRMAENLCAKKNTCSLFWRLINTLSFKFFFLLKLTRRWVDNKNIFQRLVVSIFRRLKNLQPLHKKKNIPYFSKCQSLSKQVQISFRVDFPHQTDTTFNTDDIFFCVLKRSISRAYGIKIG